MIDVHHPITYEGSLPPTERIYSEDRKQRLLIALSNASKLESVVRALELLTYSTTIERTMFEQTMLRTQAQLNRERYDEYEELASDGSRLGELVDWFSRLSKGVISNPNPASPTREYPGLRATKGLAISLGAIHYGGLWPDVDPLDERIRSLPSLVKERVSDIVVHKKGTRVAYELSAMYSHDGDEQFARLDRSRRVADLVLDDGRRMHISKKATSLVLGEQLQPVTRKKFEDWYEEANPQERLLAAERTARSVGTVYEVARDAQSLDSGIFPESASYILRAPIPRSSAKSSSDT